MKDEFGMTFQQLLNIRLARYNRSEKLIETLMRSSQSQLAKNLTQEIWFSKTHRLRLVWTRRNQSFDWLNCHGSDSHCLKTRLNTVWFNMTRRVEKFDNFVTKSNDAERIEAFMQTVVLSLIALLFWALISLLIEWINYLLNSHCLQSFLASVGNSFLENNSQHKQFSGC